MSLIILQFILSALAIITAGSFLTKFADKIADETGWGKMFVGGLLLAGATSLPELMVDLKAVELDLPDLAVGDLLGSSLFNLLILATLDFAFPSTFRRTAFSPAFLHHSLAAVLTIILTSIVGIGIASRLEISFLGVSVFSWAVVCVYLYGLRLIFLEGNLQPAEAAIGDQQLPTSLSKYKPLLFAFSGYALSVLVILAAAPYLVHAADGMSKQSGMGHTFIGTTLVALATSLPELVATIAAFRMGAPDLALGNIFGSNAFNMILFVPLDFMYPKVLFSSVRGVHAVTALSVVAATGIAVMGQLYRKKERSRFTEPSSEIVVVVIILFLFLLYWLKPI
ncbi:MAG: sodium:calcium antiporter [Bdellovibrionales bacterium]